MFSKWSLGTMPPQVQIHTSEDHPDGDGIYAFLATKTEAAFWDPSG